MGMPEIDTESLSKEKVIGDIIESIAMEEQSLSHILNAESEKIMTAVEYDNVTAEELLAINLSVKKTINSIITLETILQAKLEILKPFLC